MHPIEYPKTSEDIFYHTVREHWEQASQTLLAQMVHAWQREVDALRTERDEWRFAAEQLKGCLEQDIHP